MPDPVKAPPAPLVEETVTNVTIEYGNKHSYEPRPYERLKAQHNDAINELSYLKAFLKHNGIEVK